MDASLNPHVDWLVEKAEGFARHVVTTLRARDRENRSGSSKDQGKPKDPAADFGKSQIENLLAAINHMASLNELKLFVRYQMGRKGSEKGWKKVGDRFLSILDEIQKKDLGEAAKTAERDPHFELVKRFLLYWKWEHTYLTGNESGDGRTQDNNRKGGAR
ncbi:hypothetical protein [Kyrpidia spormannii]|uniref:CRISPR type III-B/RAMP module-associated protein Cmr5 n=1 Tax=Kyrpidia spormannii TaxID=2055160 RepID=A0A6F9EGF5_9BACL|nr:hypothetical protein [Kyrpidia spormannii]CAB3395493.1 conserved protein of unknown function [Kyrpidia spormannii]